MQAGLASLEVSLLDLQAAALLLPLLCSPSFLVSLCVLISSYKGTIQTGLGPTLEASFQRNYLVKGPVSKCSHILG